MRSVAAVFESKLTTGDAGARRGHRKSHGVHRWMRLRRDTIRVEEPAIALVDCHCIDCRRSAGAPYVQWGSVPREDLS